VISHGPEHERFDELAAGYALHALEPAEEAELLMHAEKCGRCQQTLADYAEVAASMADLARSAEPSPLLAARIMDAATASRPPRDQQAGTDSPATRDQDGGAAGSGPAGPVPGGRVISLDRRRARLTKIAAAAAAAIVLAAGGIWGGLTATSSPSQGPLAECSQDHQCSEVTLTDASGHRAAAKVIVRAGSVWLVPAGLPADNSARHIYVLWQITGAHTPLAVGSFDIQRGHGGPMRIGGLPAAYGSTWAFAVSLERGRTIPARPSHPVALGQVAG
jgi:Anti-sigma-K factor rskA